MQTCANQRAEPAELIRFRNVSYTYPTGPAQRALKNIDLTLRPGEYLLISGASGSGKSTLARAFNGLIPHFHGGTLTGGVEVDGVETLRSSVAALFDKVSLVFQNPRAQLFSRTVAQELAFGLESLGLPRAQMAARIAAVAEELQLRELLERNPQTLSGGEQQLTALAAVLVLRPRIVVLDEPLANLDAAHVRRLRDLLRQLRAQGIGVVVCEHRLVPTLPDADRLILMHAGVKQQDGPPDDVLPAGNWQASGIELPLATRIGLELDLRPLPRGVEDLPAENRGAAGLAMTLPGPAPVEKGPAVASVENLSYFIDGRPVVQRANLSVHAGQCLALVGANGAGKTTLLKLMTGLLRPDGGRIHIKDRETTGLPPWEVARDVGTAFQNPDSQFFKLTVAEEILVGPQVLKRHDAAWVEHLIDLFRLNHLLQRPPFKLSGGEKKRVAFAAALAAKPALLILDEPTAGQDGYFREALAACLDDLRRQGTAVLIVTHALNFAQRVSDTWAVMAGGRILARGAPEAIMQNQTLMRNAALEPSEQFRLGTAGVR